MNGLLLSLFIIAAASQPCNFSPLAEVNWTVAYADKVLECFQSVPFNIQWKRDTLAQLRLLVDMYSFADLSVDSGAPYNIKVDLRKGLDAIEARTQASDWQFHLEISDLFYSLGDAHTLYDPPVPYSRYFGDMTVNRLLIITASLLSGHSSSLRVWRMIDRHVSTCNLLIFCLTGSGDSCFELHSAQGSVQL